MEFLQIDGTNKDFINLCKALENYQYNLLPGIKEKGYSLTDDLDEIVVGYVLYTDNKPIGSIALKKKSDDTCEIVRVFVNENNRGKGYSKILFEKIETKAKEIGFKKSEIIAWCKAKTAVNLYQKMGYEISEEKTSEWYGGYKYVEFYKEF